MCLCDVLCGLLAWWLRRSAVESSVLGSIAGESGFHLCAYVLIVRNNRSISIIPSQEGTVTSTEKAFPHCKAVTSRCQEIKTSWLLWRVVEHFTQSAKKRSSGRARAWRFQCLVVQKCANQPKNRTSFSSCPRRYSHFPGVGLVCQGVGHSVDTCKVPQEPRPSVHGIIVSASGFL